MGQFIGNIGIQWYKHLKVAVLMDIFTIPSLNVSCKLRFRWTSSKALWNTSKGHHALLLSSSFTVFPLQSRELPNELHLTETFTRFPPGDYAIWLTPQVPDSRDANFYHYYGKSIER